MRYARWITGVLAVAAVAAVALRVCGFLRAVPARTDTGSSQSTGDGLEPAPAVDVLLAQEAKQGSSHPESPTPEVLARQRVFVVGRVVDERRSPVAHAAMELRGPAPVSAAVADDDGMFRLGAPDWPDSGTNWVIFARDDRLGYATRSVKGIDRHSSEFDCGTIELRDGRALTVRVTADGTPVPGARVYVGVDKQSAPIEASPSAGGWLLESITGADGGVGFASLPRTALRVVAVEGSRLGAATAGPDRHEVAVALDAGRSIRVRVIDAGAGAGIADARLAVRRPDLSLVDAPWAAASTDSSGSAVVGPLPPGAQFYLYAETPEWVWPDRNTAETEIRESTDEVTLRVPSPITFRWPVRYEDGDPVDNGTPVTLDARDGTTDSGGVIASMARIEHGELVASVRYPTHVRAMAALPDGRVGFVALRWDPTSSRWRNPGESVVFRKPRTVTVHATDVRGAPAEGIAIAYLRDGRRFAGPVLTDASGIAVLGGLPAEILRLAVTENPRLVEPNRVGSFSSSASQVNLTTGDSEAHLIVQELEDVVVRLEDENGDVLRGRATVGVAVWPESLVAREPPSARWAGPATIRFRLRKPTGRSRAIVEVAGDGFATERVEIDLSRARSTGGEREIVVRLQREAVVGTRVCNPVDGVAEVYLEAEMADGRWEAVARVEQRGAAGVDATTHRALHPAKMRLRDALTGVTSDALQVPADSTPSWLELDIRNAGWAEGTIDVPPAVNPNGVILHATGRGLHFDDATGGFGIGPSWRLDGRRFRVRVAGDRVVRITPEHDACVPDPSAGSVEVTSPRGDLYLKLALRR